MRVAPREDVTIGSLASGKPAPCRTCAWRSAEKGNGTRLAL